MNGRIMFVDDNRAMCDLVESGMKQHGFFVSSYTTALDAFSAANDEEFDVVLTDLQMPGMNGIDLCHRLVTNRPDIPVIVITAFGSMETAVAAIRAGAYDFITKPIEMDILALVLERAIKHRNLQEKIKTLSKVVEQSEKFGELIGTSVPMQKLYNQLSRLADYDSTVLITGESGTGKELVARVLHNQSKRSSGPFVAVNCASLPDTLMESELFGHTRGAFTDAKSARKGLFLQADGGTLLLDEIGDFPLILQPKLLRALEERTIRQIGSDREIPFDVRIIAATNRDIEAALEKGRFREDLFFRINIINIEVPPLRARSTDVLLIAQHFIEKFSAKTGRHVTGMSKAVAEKLMDYSWPGNIRELRNAMERAVALTKYENLVVEDLPEKIRAYQSKCLVIGSDNPVELLPMEEMERRYILHALKSVGGNRTVAARLLGFDRKTLYRKLQSYGEVSDNDT